MKKLQGLILLFISISAIGQQDKTAIKSISISDSTAIGTPDGKSVSKEIGAAGGNIISDDGRVELIFQVGALTQQITISIQPTTNHVPNGAGKAYQFEPSGIQFKKPVQLIFRYTDEEVKACPPDLMSFALQDHSGKWDFFEYEEWDSTAGTLKGFIHHFTGFTDVNNLMIRPNKTELAVGETADISVLDKGVIVESGEYRGDFELAFLSSNKVKWFVNEKEGGDDNVGHAKTNLFAPIGIGTKNIQYGLTGEYRAPVHLPLQNPVIVKLAVKYYSKKHKKFKWGSCECAITIYDAYRIEVTHYFTGREGFGSKMVDNANFVVKLLNRSIVIENRNNYPPKSIKEGSRIAIDEKIFLDGAPGPVDIKPNLTARSKISNDNPPNVYVEFQPSDDTYYTLHYVIRRMGISTEKVTTRARALPENFSFIANGTVQHVKQGRNNETEIIILPYSKN